MESSEVIQHRPARRSRRKKSGGLWNFLTALLVIATIGWVIYGALIFINPLNPLNPFPPDESFAGISLPSATPTEKALPATWTPTATITPTVTETRMPPTPTNTQFVLGGGTVTLQPSNALTPSPTANLKGLPFELRNKPDTIASTIMHPDLGCKWTGVGGQVFDLQGAPMVGVTVQMGGRFGGSEVYLLSLTGTAIQYGPAGYEFTLGDKPAASNQTLWVQLLDQAGLPLSDKVTFETYDDCSKNLVLINFKQVR